jgi:hypothetical protein
MQLSADAMAEQEAERAKVTGRTLDDVVIDFNRAREGR